MKNLTTITTIVLLSLCSATSFAQNTLAQKPLLFSKYPDTIYCTAAQLSNFFKTIQGQNVNVSFNNNLTLAGTVKSVVTKYNNLQTVTVKLSVFNNILFSVSKRTDLHNNIIYVGHLFDKDYADGYELKKAESGNYQFIKVDMAKILPACTQQ